MITGVNWLNIACFFLLSCFHGSEGHIAVSNLKYCLPLTVVVGGDSHSLSDVSLSRSHKNFLKWFVPVF